MSDSREDNQDGSIHYDEILDEHRGCMRLLSAVEGCLDRKPDDRQAWLAELKQALDRLSPVLRLHFETEESGPLFRELPIKKPRLADQLAELEAEHPVMIKQIDRILQGFAGFDDPEVFELREFNARVQLFVARLRRHEAAENELVIQAHWDEVGVGD